MCCGIILRMCTIVQYSKAVYSSCSIIPKLCSIVKYKELCSMIIIDTLSIPVRKCSLKPP